MAKKKSDKTQSLLSGTLPSLQDTGQPLTDITANLKTLKSNYYPGTLPLFQQTMSGIAERVYKARQNADMNAITPYFNPTQVSGGTMSSVLGWLEGNRGKDISSMYSSTMQGYQKSQELVANEINSLEQMRYNIQKDVQAFKTDLITKMPGVYEGLSKKDKESIELGMPSKGVYQMMDDFSKDIYQRNKQWEDEQRQMQKEEHDLQIQIGNQKLSEGTPAQQKLDFVKNVQGAMNWMAQQRQSNGFTQSDITNQEMIDQGLTSQKTGTSSSSLYNTVDDYWTAFFQVMQNSPTADPSQVQGYLAKFLSPADRSVVDISGDVSMGIENMKNFTDKLEKQYGDSLQDSRDITDVPTNVYDAYWDAKLKLMMQ